MRQFTGIIEREGNRFVALCPELDIASQGNTVEEARTNLIEAIELFFEVAEQWVALLLWKEVEKELR